MKLKKFVFVLMPFDKTFDDIYAFGIKQTCKHLDAYCERVDEQIFSERILDRIYNQISKADIIIADMSNRNANVFYEVGYAHGIGKNVILLTSNADDIPFDLKHFPHIVYDGQIKTLSSQLSTKLEWFLNEDNSSEINDIDFNLEFSINGQKITEGVVINLTNDLKGQEYYTEFDLKIDIYNSSSKIYKSKFKIGLEVFNSFSNYIKNLESIKPSQEKVLFVSEDFSNIYPNAFKRMNFKIKQESNSNSESKLEDVCLKVFTRFELKQIHFKIKIDNTKIIVW